MEGAGAGVEQGHEALSTALYAAGPERVGLVEAFRRAQRRVAEDHPGSDWSTFRLYVR